MRLRSVSRLRAICVVAIFAAAAVMPGFAGISADRGYALILSDAPLAEHLAAREDRSAVETARAGIERAHASVRANLEARGMKPVASLNTLLNAVLVRTTPDRVAELQSIPGVVRVVPLRRYHVVLNSALDILQVPAAWNAIGGQDKAGLGVRIAILDTGVDNTHPAFQDSSLPMPAGFPRCANTAHGESQTGYDCAAFTNNKVIVAKSFVQYINSANDAKTSTPDDYTPRDRFGHGTATAMCAAGETVTGNLGPGSADVTISGVAPKAYIGSYKVVGTDGQADDSSILTGLEEAEHDGMNVASVSLGAAALGPPGEDPEATAVENAARLGMTVVIAVGNLGDTGQIIPTPGTVSSPGIAASAITVGGVENAHQFSSALVVPGLQNFSDVFGDGPIPGAPLTAPLIDVAKIGADSYACSALPANSLSKDLALIQRGPESAPCTFETKAKNAAQAGAVGIVFYDYTDEDLIQPGGVSGTGLPSVMISKSDGVALQKYVDDHAGATATLDPTIRETTNPNAKRLLAFSSRGPVLGPDAGLKPDVLAVGHNVFMATQNYDYTGEMYSQSRFIVAGGTSFSTPMVAGAAAVVIGNELANGTKIPDPSSTALPNNGWAHPQDFVRLVKSAIVNTADPNVTDTNGKAASVAAKGAGIMNVAAAVQDNVTIYPANLSFGSLTAAALPQTLTITNHGTSAVSLSFSVVNDTNATSKGNQVAVNPSTISLSPGATQTVQVTLSGGVPAAGLYAGQINVAGASVPLHVPFIFGAPNAAAHYIVPIFGSSFDGTAGQELPYPMGVQFLDQNGFPIPNYSATWKVTAGDAQLRDVFTDKALGTTTTTVTDSNGISYMEALLGTANSDTITVQAGKDATLNGSFTATARPVPKITKFQDSASFTTGAAVSPGSYLTLYGTNLSDVTAPATQLPLPVNIAGATVSFDLVNAICAPYSDHCSFAGRLQYASATQVNVLVPTELTSTVKQLMDSGKTPGCGTANGICALVKVFIDQTNGFLAQVPLTLYDPAFFINGGVVAAEDAVTGAVLTKTNPAKKNEYVALYCNGLGPVDQNIPTGEAAPSSPLANTTTRPVVKINGKPVPDANITFSGLAPGFAGLYQVNVQIPADAPSGLDKITISIGGATSPEASIQIQ